MMGVLLALSLAANVGLAVLWLRSSTRPRPVIRRGEFGDVLDVCPGIVLGKDESGNVSVKLINRETKQPVQFTGIEAWGIETGVPQGVTFDTLSARILLKGVPAFAGE